jgi:hypothetical protein
MATMKQQSWDDFWENYQWPEPPTEPEYRLYYDDQGAPIAYTTQDMPGKYIVVTAHEHAMASRRVRVKDGKLQPYRSNAATKLRPHPEQGVPCHRDDVTVVVDQQQPHQRWARL